MRTRSRASGPIRRSAGPRHTTQRATAPYLLHGRSASASSSRPSPALRPPTAEPRASWAWSLERRRGECRRCTRLGSAARRRRNRRRQWGRRQLRRLRSAARAASDTRRERRRRRSARSSAVRSSPRNLRTRSGVP